MSLTPPKLIVFWVSVALALLGILGMFNILIPVALGTWMFLGAWVILFLGVVLKDF